MPDVKRVLKGIEMLKTTGIKLHADLIAGLPYETFDMFGYSFVIYIINIPMKFN